VQLHSTGVDLERIKTARIISIMILGFAIGMLSGLLGIGGGAVLVPALVYLLGLSQHRAHGTSLAYMSPVALFTALSYSGHGHVDWLVAIELAIGGVIGAGIGARICALTSARRLRTYFGLFLAAIGLRMIYEARAVFAAAAGPVVAGHAFPPDQLLGALAVVMIGIITGTASGLLGVGGGIVMIPALVLLFGYTQKLAQGISLAVIIPVSISGTLIHSRHGNVRWHIAVWLALGGILGGLVGARIANVEVGDPVLRGMFGLLMLIMAGLMMRRRPQVCD